MYNFLHTEWFSTKSFLFVVNIVAKWKNKKGNLSSCNVDE